MTDLLIGPDSLVDRVYEAAVIPEFWPQVLRDFALAADSRVAALIANSNGQFRWITCSERGQELALRHYEYSGGHERSRRLLAMNRAGFVTDSDAFTEAEIMAEPLYRDYLIPNGYGRGTATAIYVPTGETLIFNAEGDYKRGPFTAEVIARLDHLRPHLARSALISARLAFERARTAVETLAGIRLAACAVLQNGTVLVANTLFDADRTHWTTRGAERVALLDRLADRQLYEALAIGTGQGVRSIPLRGGPETSPAVLHVVPVRRAAHDLFGQATAILVLTKASATPTNQTPLLQALFDLSPTEAAIAARIAAGQSIDEIARADAKSVETVRNQLKSVLAKTGCRRQLDLARMLAQMVPGQA